MKKIRSKKTIYDMQYIKEHKKKFQVDLNKDEYLELECLLSKREMTKVQFVRNAKKELERGKNEKRLI